MLLAIGGGSLLEHEEIEGIGKKYKKNHTYGMDYLKTS